MKELLQEISINAIELGTVNAELSPKQSESFYHSQQQIQWG
jgi:hypothetical protein